METELKTFEFPSSVLTRNQVLTRARINKDEESLKVFLRYDDECKNGHNTFAITGELREKGRFRVYACGCLHDEIRETFPELAKYIKWHLCSSDGPMYYIANTIYHIREGNIEYAKHSAVWEDMPANIMDHSNETIKNMLIKRLPKLMNDFKRDMEEIGFTY